MKSIGEEVSITVSKQLNEKVTENNLQFNVDKKEDFSIYTNFMLNNKIIIKQVNIINVPSASLKEILKFKTQIKEITKSFIGLPEIKSKFEKFEINNIKYYHYYNETIFLEIITLIDIHNFILNKDNYFPNIIKVPNTKNNEIISNISIDKNSFISKAFGYYWI